MSSLAKVCGWLLQTYGLKVDALGEHALDRAIRRRMSSTARLEVSDYLTFWDRTVSEREQLLLQVLVGETWFFREPPAFDLLSTWLTERFSRWTADGPLRILVLPCSTGEEAWSVAAVVHSLGIVHASIEAMDINEDALGVARSGCYPLRKARHGIQPESIGRCLDGMIEVNPSFRTLVTFEKANALDQAFFEARKPYDVIFCRNLLIYMDDSARSRLFAMISSRLSQQGLLFLGHAEFPPSNDVFRRLRVQGTFAWQRCGLEESALAAQSLQREGGGSRWS